MFISHRQIKVARFAAQMGTQKPTNWQLMYRPTRGTTIEDHVASAGFRAAFLDVLRVDGWHRLGAVTDAALRPRLLRDLSLVSTAGARRARDFRFWPFLLDVDRSTVFPGCGERFPPAGGAEPGGTTGEAEAAPPPPVDRPLAVPPHESETCLGSNVQWYTK